MVKPQQETKGRIFNFATIHKNQKKKKIGHQQSQRHDNKKKQECLTKECIHCGQVTLSKFNANKKKVTYDANIPACATINCKFCGQKTCINCAIGFVSVAKNNLIKKILSEVEYCDLCNKNPWFQNIKSFAEHQKQNCNFVGACCTIKDQKVNNNISESQREGRKERSERSERERSFEGMLHLYEHNLLISPTLSDNCIDVHSFAADHTIGMKPLLHGVMNAEQADRAHHEYESNPSLKPNGSGARKVYDEIREFVIPKYFESAKNIKKCNKKVCLLYSSLLFFQKILLLQTILVILTHTNIIFLLSNAIHYVT